MAITLRNTVGRALTYAELDANFTTLDSAIDALPDSAQVIGLIYTNSIDSARTIGLIDSAYVQARQTSYNTADFVDSAGVSAIITADVDKAYVDALNIDADTLDGQNGTHYLDYNNFTNTPTIPVQNKTNIDALNVDADTLDNEDGTYYLDYGNFTNTPTVLDSDLVDSSYVRTRADRVQLKSFAKADSAEFNTFPAGTLIFLTDGNNGDPCIAVKDSANGNFLRIALGADIGGGGF